MASKRKKSKPTRITKDDGVANVVQVYNQISANEDDTLKKIQKFIEEGSEDTPDSLQMKLEQSQIKKGVDLHEQSLIELTSENHSSNNGEKIFPTIFTNGQIPSNLKFHQLLKDEEESMASTDPPNSSQELASLDSNEKVFKQSRSEGSNVSGVGLEALSFKQVARFRKSPGKRTKPTDDETPRYSCTQCKYVTNRSDHYKRHLMTHSADKPLKCTLCSYGTGRSDHYKRHLQRHGMSEKDIIATCFRNGLKLKNTTLTGPSSDGDFHPKESKENVQQKHTLSEEKAYCLTDKRKKYKCDVCSYSTDKSSHLTRHKNSHSRAMMSHCDMCNKSFKTPSYLNQHRCGYASDRRCPKCRETFVDRASMLRHIVDKHHDDDALIAATMPVLRKLEAEVNDAGIAAHAVDITKDKSDAVKKCDVEGILTKSESDDLKPMDLTVMPRSESQTLTGTDDCEIADDKDSSTDSDKQSTKYVTNLPSNGGNLGCTKCGEWFNKLNEYSTHACVS